MKNFKLVAGNPIAKALLDKFKKANPNTVITIKKGSSIGQTEILIDPIKPKESIIETSEVLTYKEYIGRISKILKRSLRMKTLLTILLTISLTCQGQDLKYVITNTVSGGMQAGLIAFINNPKPKSFLNAFWKGCIGGSLNYTGKRLIEQSAMNNNLNLIWPARIVNSLGSSMVYNGALNKGLLSSISMNLYFLNMQFDGTFKMKIDPYTFCSATVLSLNRNNYFEIKKSLQTGSIIFCKKNDVGGNGNLGENFGNAMIYKIYPQYSYDLYGNSTMVSNSSLQIICHELIHGMQYEQFRSLDLITTHKIKMFHNINRYFVLSPGLGLLYLSANLKGCDKNMFENEADYFANSNLKYSPTPRILFRPNPYSRKWN